MDDGHGNTKNYDQAQHFLKELAKHVMVKESFIHETGATYEHLKRQFSLHDHGTMIQATLVHLQVARPLVRVGGQSGRHTVCGSDTRRTRRRR